MNAVEITELIESGIAPSLHLLGLDELVPLATLVATLAEDVAKLIAEKQAAINLPVAVESARIETEIELDEKFGVKP